jgi:NAD-dependent deacetylase
MKKIVVFTGAGMSAESGIKTFRDSDGLWENYKIEEVATPEAWQRNPSMVQQFYNERRKNILESQPNEAHFFIKDLENSFDVQVVTQNIDDLHERAGSKNVLHLHGNIRMAKSSGPNQEKKYYPIEGWELKMADLCDDGFPLRPHVVWFGEEVPMLNVAWKIIEKAEIFIVIGSSLQVYPVASLIHAVKKDCTNIFIDPNASSILTTTNFTCINETAVNALPKLKKILSLT